MIGICGTNCKECSLYKKKCNGCNGCPFGKKCFIADYIEIGGKENYELFKKQLISEINCLDIDGLDKINELYPLNGSLVNLEYRLPNGKMVKYLDDNDIYLGNQVEFNDKYIGIVCNMSFILVCEYDKDYNNPEIIIYKRR